MSVSIAEQFRLWVREQPADEQYDYFDVERCACGQFCREHGIPHDLRAKLEMPNRLGLILIDHPRTFGALAERLDAARLDSLPASRGMDSE